ncbi:hypothetical protein ACF0H5_022516 [Mactra antiquata]
MEIKRKNLHLLEITLFYLILCSVGVCGAKKVHKDVKASTNVERHAGMNSDETGATNDLNKRLSDMERQIQLLIDRDQMKTRLIVDLERKIGSLESNIELRDKTTEAKDNLIDGLNVNVLSQPDDIPQEKPERGQDEHASVDSKIESKLRRPMQDIGIQHILKRNRRAVVGGVAFSAYLTRTNSHMTPSQPIKFDHVLLNDGDAYNVYTGAFSAPVTGTYLFTYHIDSRKNKFVRLVINGVNENDAVANPHINAPHGENESMGGNSVILRVQRGQAVLVETYAIADSEVASSDTYRLSTFSGVLLY